MFSNSYLRSIRDNKDPSDKDMNFRVVIVIHEQEEADDPAKT